MKVSVIIPYRVDRGFLDYAVDSVECQTYKDIELIHSRSDNKLGYNVNRGLEKATGDYIKILSDDDILPVNAIQDLVDSIGDADFIHGNAINYFQNGNPEQKHVPHILEPTLEDIVLRGNPIHGGTVMYKREAIEKYGFFDEHLWTGEEFELHLRWLSRGAKIAYCDSVVYFYRRWSQQKSLGLRTKAYQSERKKAIDQIRNYYADNYIQRT